MSNTADFLQELEKLSLKYGVTLGGKIGLKTEDFVGITYGLEKDGRIYKNVTYKAFQTVNPKELINLPTENQEWGFYGTRALYHSKTVKKDWKIALTLLVKLSGKSPEAVREFLDSRMGRHLADACHGEELVQAINREYNKSYCKTLATWETDGCITASLG